MQPIKDMGLRLACCHKGKIGDLQAELGLFGDLFRSLVAMGNKSRICDIVESTVSVKNFRRVWHSVIFRAKQLKNHPVGTG